TSSHRYHAWPRARETKHHRKIKISSQQLGFIEAPLRRGIKNNGEIGVKQIKKGNVACSRFEDEEDDPRVERLITMILEDYPFEPNMWVGEIKADDAPHLKEKSSRR
ncbi:unnamed protein product, partial [Thlaspi arvense]